MSRHRLPRRYRGRHRAPSGWQRRLGPLIAAVVAAALLLAAPAPLPRVEHYSI